MNENKTNINWYPGHMAKTKRLISENLKYIDIVYELVDCRIPCSSKLNDIDAYVQDKPKILIMTKFDLCDKKETLKWKEFYEKNGYINTTDFTLFLEDKTSLINETLRIDDLKLPCEINDDVINDYINTIDEGLIKKEIENIKNKIGNETNVAKKVVLLEKLRSLKKKECK